MAALSVPFFLSFQYRTELDSATNLTVRAIRTAQQNASNSQNDDDWGVNITPGAIIVFRGNNFASRDTEFDIPYNIADRVVVNGTNEYVFTKRNGLPVSTGSTTLSVESNSKTISVNQQGAITY